jgi:Domain of unknown function (DUF4381)
MTDDPGSLANLRDIMVPPAVPFWPPAPGIWIIGAALLAMLAIAAWRGMKRYRTNAYRRAAAAELDAIAANPTVDQVSAIIKRAALVAYPWSEVASLSGAAWAAFVTARSGREGEAPTMRRLLSNACDPHQQPNAADLRSLIDEAKRWVFTHPAEAAAETS